MRSVFIFFIQRKGNVVLCTAECMWENGNIVPVFLNLSTRWNEWSGFHHCSFIPGGKTNVTYWAFLDIFGKWEISYSCQELKSDSSYIHLVALTLFWLYYLGHVFYKTDILSWHYLHFIPDISSSCMVFCSTSTFQFTYLNKHYLCSNFRTFFCRHSPLNVHIITIGFISVLNTYSLSFAVNKYL